MDIASISYSSYSDVEKVPLPISVNKKKINFLRFLCFKDMLSNEKLVIVRNRFASVVFGVNISPILLNGILRKHTI